MTSWMTSGSGVYAGLLWCLTYCVEWKVLHTVANKLQRKLLEICPDQ